MGAGGTLCVIHYAARKPHIPTPPSCSLFSIFQNYAVGGVGLRRRVVALKVCFHFCNALWTYICYISILKTTKWENVLEKEQKECERHQCLSKWAKMQNRCNFPLILDHNIPPKWSNFIINLSKNGLMLLADLSLSPVCANRTTADPPGLD